MSTKKLINVAEIVFWVVYLGAGPELRHFLEIVFWIAIAYPILVVVRIVGPELSTLAYKAIEESCPGYTMSIMRTAGIALVAASVLAGVYLGLVPAIILAVVAYMLCNRALVRNAMSTVS